MWNPVFSKNRNGSSFVLKPSDGLCWLQKGSGLVRKVGRLPQYHGFSLCAGIPEELLCIKLLTVFSFSWYLKIFLSPVPFCIFTSEIMDKSLLTLINIWYGLKVGEVVKLFILHGSPITYTDITYCAENGSWKWDPCTNDIDGILKRSTMSSELLLSKHEMNKKCEMKQIKKSCNLELTLIC